MTLVKICGLSTSGAVRAADEADYAGFIVGSPKSHRNISVSKFLELKEHLTHAKPVLVTVNHSMKFLHELRQIDDVIIQLHGNAREFADIIEKSAIGLDYIEFSTNKFYRDYFYSFLSIDSTEKNGYGGTGKSWNWRQVQPHQNTQPILVAGGIGYNNAVQALERTQADGIDVSSSVEINKEKSRQKISDLITLVRGLS